MERVDDLHRKGRRLIQDPALFCFGVDAVLLAWFAEARRGERALDLCAGNGAVGILMQARFEAARYDGLEILPENVDLARRSIALNGLEGAVAVTLGDIRAIGEYFPAHAFDAVTCNPPYIAANGGLTNRGGAKAVARHEILCTLSDAAGAAAYALKPGGRAYFVHRPERLTDLLCGLRAAGLEPKRLRLVHSRAGDAPRLALVCAVSGGKPGLAVEPPVALYREDGGYTAMVNEIYYG